MGSSFKKWVLDEQGNPRPAELLEWARFFESGRQQIALDNVGAVQVSTIFAGMDHAHGRGSEPVLWETKITGGEHDGERWRYTCRAHAIAGHARALALVLGAL